MESMINGDIQDILISGAKDIIDISKDLPTQAGRYFRLRKLSAITGIVVHHSASPMGRYTPYDFARWHIDPKGRLNAPAICYHFGINHLGVINKTSDLENICWHAGNANNFTIGIELDGNFEIEQPTEAALSSLRWLIGYLEDLLGKELTVEPHKKYMATACCGKNLIAVKDKWKFNKTTI